MKFKQLVDDVEDDLNYGHPNLEFENLAKQWIGNNKLVSHRTNPEQGNVIVVTHDVDQSLYDVLRFFTIGDRWQVSVDFQQVKLDAIIEHLKIEIK